MHRIIKPLGDSFIVDYLGEEKRIKDNLAKILNNKKSEREFIPAEQFSIHSVHSQIRLMGIEETVKHRLYRHMSPNVGNQETNSPHGSAYCYKITKEIESLITIEAFFNTTEFTHLLEITHKAFFEDSCGIRNCWVRTGRGFDNVVTYYPDPSIVSLELENVNRIISRYIDRFPIICALSVYVMLLAIHPFPDGNGRVSRIIMNLIIRKFVDRRLYCPIFELEFITRKSLLLSCREAMINRCFDSLFQVGGGYIRASQLT